MDDVLGHLHGGLSVEEVLADFPELTIEDIEARRAYEASQSSRNR